MPEGLNYIRTGFEKILRVATEGILLITFNINCANDGLVRGVEDGHDYLGMRCSKGGEIARIGGNVSDIDGLLF